MPSLRSTSLRPLASILAVLSLSACTVDGESGGTASTPSPVAPVEPTPTPTPTKKVDHSVLARKEPKGREASPVDPSLDDNLGLSSGQTASWTPTLEVPGAKVIVQAELSRVTGVQGACAIAVGYVSYEVVQGALTRTQFSTYLEKADAANGHCTGPRGFRLLRSHLQVPTAFLARHPSKNAVVLAYTWQNRGQEPIFTSAGEIDWVTGRDERALELGTSPGVTGLSFVGDDVILEGTGLFPGATGDGPSYRATYEKYLLNADPAKTVPATHAERS